MRNHRSRLALVGLLTVWTACGDASPDLQIDELQAIADRRLRVVREAAESVETVTIDGTYELLLKDNDRDGVIDYWGLKKNGRDYAHRWARAGHGGADALEVYDSKGQSLGIVAWGHYREEEAEKYRQQMDQEIDSGTEASGADSPVRK